MRLAHQVPTASAVAKADAELASNKDFLALIGGRPPKATVACEFGAARTVWFDVYAANGGEFFEICGERVAPLVADPVVAQVADQVFFARHPELKGKRLEFHHEDGSARAEWMDLYVEYGGRFAEICGPERCA
jgi:hypothetical protein